jgi:HEAT repeat protein
MHEPAFYDGASIPELCDLLKSEAADERADAACALGDRVRCREVTALEPNVVEALVLLLQDEVPLVQFEAAMALAEVHEKRATELLLEATGLKAFRLDAVRALGTLGDPAAKEPLRKLLNRWLLPWADRLQAAAALCALGDAEGAAYLEAKLASRRKYERAAAVHFIGESHHPRALVILSAMLADAAHPLRDVAARALGFVSQPGAREALLQARASANEELLVDIDAALERQSRDLTPPAGSTNPR